MRFISVLIISTLILCSCKNDNSVLITTFNAKATINICDIVFLSEINESQISFEGENFEIPVIFSENILLCDGFSVEVFPERNSAFLLPELVLRILNDRKINGVFNDIEYYCEFENNTVLSKIMWGDVMVVFDYFE